MTEVLNLRVVRPYATEEEFLEAEGWTVNLRSVLLIGVLQHPEGVEAKVDLRLSSGKSLVVAEGSVVKHLPETNTRPAGLVVRFRRMSATTSEFIKRAVAHNAERSPGSSPMASSPSVIQPPPPPRPPTESQSVRPKAPPAMKPESLPSASRRPPGTTKSSRPPSGSVTGGRIEGRSSAPPDGPRAHRVSVIPAARRASTQPPPTAPALRSTPPSPIPEAPSPKSVATATSRPSTETSHAAAPKVAAETSHRDSDAMDRLRRRDASKPITVPPDREAILARLKKP